jgi:Family of unknown function (DUF5677)/SEC-C motif
MPTYRGEDEIELGIAKEFHRELSACFELRDAYLERAEPWTGRTSEGSGDRIVLLEIGRSTKTYRAAIEMARKGYGEQAAMLNRALFESMVVARWINANGEAAAERFPRALEFENYLTVKRLKNTGWLKPEEEIEVDIDEQDLVKLREDFGTYNERLWTGHDNVRGLLDDIKDQFSERAWTLVQNYLRTGHQENNQLLHSTVGGLRQAFVNLEDGCFAIWTGPSDAMIGRVLFSAHMIYQQTLMLAVERFSLDDRDGLDVLLAQHQHVFRRLADEELRNIGRNDLCPCGSGEKFKRCHGS